MFRLIQKARNFIGHKLVQWLACDRKNNHIPFSNFNYLREVANYDLAY
ncbi:MAG: hypothetical protein OQK32_04615 [Gammaproteobacteria bacterium]|nr:hypothetical protein [Gammaproteobacteria bacterium]MCW8923173.1 hypothetical protein [Gammaproteobacteria bacterium]